MAIDKNPSEDKIYRTVFNAELHPRMKNTTKDIFDGFSNEETAMQAYAERMEYEHRFWNFLEKIFTKTNNHESIQEYWHALFHREDFQDMLMKRVDSFYNMMKHNDARIKAQEVVDAAKKTPLYSPEVAALIKRIAACDSFSSKYTTTADKTVIVLKPHETEIAIIRKFIGDVQNKLYAVDYCNVTVGGGFMQFDGVQYALFIQPALEALELKQLQREREIHQRAAERARKQEEERVRQEQAAAEKARRAAAAAEKAKQNAAEAEKRAKAAAAARKIAQQKAEFIKACNNRTK